MVASETYTCTTDLRIKKNTASSTTPLTRNTHCRHEFLSSGGEVRCRANTAPNTRPQTNPPIWAELSIAGTTAPKNKLYAANRTRLLSVDFMALAGTGK